MITYLRGEIASLSPTIAVVECHGVGYEVHISLTTYAALNGQKNAKVLTMPIIREDAHLLYGFASELERELFALLLGVSGVGASTARLILSQYLPSELNTILALGQVDALKAVKGIGLKTAQRIVLELKGKLELEADAQELSPKVRAHAGALNSQAQEEAVSALKMLGYADAAASKVVRQILSEQPLLEVGEVIKLALQKI